MFSFYILEFHTSVPFPHFSDCEAIFFFLFFCFCLRLYDEYLFSSFFLFVFHTRYIFYTHSSIYRYIFGIFLFDIFWWLFNCLLRYEPYLWENERQSYQRHAVLFGFFVQLNRMYTDTVQKLPSNSESNIMRCSSVPRFKYLPIRFASVHLFTIFRFLITAFCKS